MIRRDRPSDRANIWKRVRIPAREMAWHVAVDLEVILLAVDMVGPRRCEVPLHFVGCDVIGAGLASARRCLDQVRCGTAERTRSREDQESPKDQTPIDVSQVSRRPFCGGGRALGSASHSFWPTRHPP